MVLSEETPPHGTRRTAPALHHERAEWIVPARERRGARTKGLAHYWQPTGGVRMLPRLTPERPLAGIHDLAQYVWMMRLDGKEGDPDANVTVDDFGSEQEVLRALLEQALRAQHFDLVSSRLMVARYERVSRMLGYCAGRESVLTERADAAAALDAQEAGLAVEPVGRTE